MLRRAGTSPVTLGVLVAASLVAPGPALAVDDKPCAPPVPHPEYGKVQYCPLSRGNVPVYAGRKQESGIIGYLRKGGSANWFLGYQCRDGTIRLGRLANDWWAAAKADNGRLGWVPEIYFAGGGNFEPDAGLLRTAC
ncbi:hypothetical protein [Actinomadura sp. NBRC 104425]|uniref:hypothetical protein n=1 Tax=Actinomadura sp. NBRC 104425 TaxID=3032204 RepID=UPI002552AFBA|nr:hypothetical protein [Actinomadura sp. NBRC 104425]